MKAKYLFLAALLIAILVPVAFIIGYNYTKPSNISKTKSPLTWEECIKIQGARMLLTYPSICTTPDGRSITQPVTN